MSWNYRVVHVVGKYQNGNPFNYYEVREAYYDKCGQVNSLTADYAAPGGEDSNEFLRDWTMYQRALRRPVLVWDSIDDKFVGEEPPLLEPLAR
jgi:hypothetical protein